MIFYFSGTGNSAWVAQTLAEALSQPLVHIAEAMRTPQTYESAEGEPLGFVFPTYAWGLPRLIERFIESVDVRNVSYVFMLTTCGDDTGTTAQQFIAKTSARGWSSVSCWAVQMPESYVCLPGFEVDPTDKERRKIEVATERLHTIAAAINHRKPNIIDSIPGRFAWAKSHLIRPIFNALLTSPKHFRTTDACTACGKCAQVCPLHNIRMTESTPKRPAWSTDCAMCLRCYHSCPVRAIRWGHMMEHKGQYLFGRRKA